MPKRKKKRKFKRHPARRNEDVCLRKRKSNVASTYFKGNKLEKKVREKKKGTTRWSRVEKN